MQGVEVVESQLRQVFMSIVWTHKIQEKQADLYLKESKWIDVFKIFLSALTSSGIVAAIFYTETWLKIVTALISGISLFVSTYCKTYDMKVLHKQHKDVALELLELREDLISVLCDIKMKRYDEAELILKRDELVYRKVTIAKRTPDPTDKAVDLACQNLNVRKDNTYSDEEIDNCLPIEARKTPIRSCSCGKEAK